MGCGGTGVCEPFDRTKATLNDVWGVSAFFCFWAFLSIDSAGECAWTTGAGVGGAAGGCE